jgi:hypothetical protein
MTFDATFNMTHLEKLSSLAKRAAVGIEKLILAKVKMINGCQDKWVEKLIYIFFCQLKTFESTGFIVTYRIFFLFLSLMFI